MQKLDYHFISLTKEACLKAFWKKNELHSFLKAKGIPKNEIAIVVSQDTTKANSLISVFNYLSDSKNNEGHKLILEIARDLSKMKSFPDLEGYEDSKKKIEDATKATQKLKIEVEKINDHLTEERNIIKRRNQEQKRKEENLKSISSLPALEDKLKEITSLIGTQEGGYKFEKWVYELAIIFDIMAKPSFKSPDGRQIDGAITIDGTTYLLEMKFTKNPSCLDDITSFMAKITKKADNTMGILISMSGFDEGAIQEASRERTPLLLMDYSHIYYILKGSMSFQEVVGRIRRHASQTGEAFLKIDKFSG